MTWGRCFACLIVTSAVAVACSGDGGSKGTTPSSNSDGGSNPAAGGSGNSGAGGTAGASAGSNHGNLVFSCTIPPIPSSGPSAAIGCVNYYADMGAQFETYKMMFQTGCQGVQGTQSTTPCPTANALGSCSTTPTTAQQGNASQVSVYYSPDDESLAKMNCSMAGQTWGPYSG